MKTLVKSFIVAGLIATIPAVAQAAETSPITGNISFVSDYLWRGQTQTWGKPAIQGGIDYNHPSGFFVGTWASNVSGNQYSNGSSMEWDVYAGYNGKITPDLTYLVKVAAYFYPGAHYNNVAKTKYDSQELILGVTYKYFNLQYSYMLSDFYGTNNETMGGTNGGSKGSDYIEANFNYELPQKINFVAHAGKTRVKNYGTLDFSDYKIGISKEIAGFNWGLTYTTTDAKSTAGVSNYLLANPFNPTDTRDIGDSRLAVSVSKSF